MTVSSANALMSDSGHLASSVNAASGNEICLANFSIESALFSLFDHFFC